MRLAGRLLVLGILVAGVPSAQAGVSAPVGSTPTTIYMHLIDFQDFPMNTQPPDLRFTSQASFGLGTVTLSCFPNPPSGATPFSDWHTWFGYSTPTYVEYWLGQDGNPRVNNQRGLSWDVTLDEAVRPELHWYLAVQTEAVPTPVPNVVIEATLRAPDSISVDDAAYGTGPIIASGRSAPALLAGDATQGAEHSMAGGMHVYGFTVPLDLKMGSVPGASGYTLTVRATMQNPVCPVQEGSVMPSQVVPFTDPDHLPRLQLAAMEPLRIEALEPGRANGTLRVDAMFNSAWGSYDVDEGNVSLTVEGPDGPVEVRLESIVQRTHEWYHFTEPVRAAWTMEEDLPTGLYWVNLTIENDQHTSTAVAHAAFLRASDGSYRFHAAPEGGGRPDVTAPVQAMPGLPVALLVFALGTALAIVRRPR